MTSYHQSPFTILNETVIWASLHGFQDETWHFILVFSSKTVFLKAIVPASLKAALD